MLQWVSHTDDVDWEEHGVSRGGALTKSQSWVVNPGAASEEETGLAS